MKTTSTEASDLQAQIDLAKARIEETIAKVDLEQYTRDNREEEMEKALDGILVRNPVGIPLFGNDLSISNYWKEGRQNLNSNLESAYREHESALDALYELMEKAIPIGVMSVEDDIDPLWANDYHPAEDDDTNPLDLSPLKENAA